MGVELELKFAANEAVLSHIKADYPNGMTISMETTYYDTPKGDLSQRRYTLRKRLENGISVCTVKIPLPGNSRGEWETEAPDILTAIPRLCALGAPENLMTIPTVIPICGAKFTRHAVLIEKEDFTAELAMDAGILTGCSKEIPLCEVELEYKSGNTESFFAFTKSFANTYSLCPEPLSKFRRAFNLYLGEK